MVLAVVLDADVPAVPAHVDATDVIAVPVVDVDLCALGRQPGFARYEPCARFLRRLGTGVGQVDG